jgi:hypothetical protein
VQHQQVLKSHRQVGLQVEVWVSVLLLLGSLHWLIHLKPWD